MADTAAAPVAGAPSATATSTGGETHSTETTQTAAGGTATGTPAPEQGTPTASQKYKLKVNGQEREYEADQVVAYAQKALAGEVRFEEGARMRKEAEQLLAAIKADPWKILSHPSIGLDPDKLAEERMLQRLQAEQMTPEQREWMKRKQDIETREAKIKEAEAKQQAAAQEAQQQHWAQQYAKAVEDALSQSQIPKTPAATRRVLTVMKEYLDHGVELNISQAASIVREDLLKEISEIVGQADAPAVLQMLGDGVADKIRKHDVAKLKGGPAVPTQQPVPQPRKEAPQYKSLEKLREELDAKYGG